MTIKCWTQPFFAVIQESRGFRATATESNALSIEACVWLPQMAIATSHRAFCYSPSPARILMRRNCLQMVGATANSVSAQVVDSQPRGDRPYAYQKHCSVDGATFPVDADTTIASARSPKPLPAIAKGYAINDPRKDDFGGAHAYKRAMRQFRASVLLVVALAEALGQVNPVAAIFRTSTIIGHLATSIAGVARQGVAAPLPLSIVQDDPTCHWQAS